MKMKWNVDKISQITIIKIRQERNGMDRKR